MDAVTTPPVAINEPIRSYAPGSARARLARGAGRRARGAEPRAAVRPSAASSAWAAARRCRSCSRTRATHVLGTLNGGDPRRRRRRRSPRRRRRRRPGATCRTTTAPRSSSRRPTCSPARGATPSTPRRCSARARPATRPRSTRPASSSTSGASTSASARKLLAEQPISSPGRLEPHSTTARSRASSTRSRRSTSPRSPATCRPRRRSWATSCVWKPAHTQQLAAHFLMRLLEEAGLPPGVINMVTGHGVETSEVGAAATPTSRACTSPARPASSSSCGATIGENIARTAPTRASSARPAARTS